MPTAAEIARANQHFEEVTGRGAPDSGVVREFINTTGRVPSGNDLQSFANAGAAAGGGHQVITQETIIPDFLKPIIQQQADRTKIGNQALKDLRDLIDRGNLVAPLNEDQLQALDLSRGFAGSTGLSQALESVRSTAAGEQLQGRAGINFLRQLTQGTAPDPNTSSSGFQNAFEAAVRRAQPNISARFAAAGRSGSGLAQTAQTQAAADSFAGLFNQQQARQFGAAQTLGNLFNTERGRQLNAAQIFPQLGQVPAQIRGRVGDVLQNQAQRERTAPLQALQGFASTAAGSAIPVNVGALTGTQTTQPIQPTALIQNLTAAGIDPRSPEGQSIITNALGAGGGGGGSSGGGLGGALFGGLGGAATGAKIGSVVPGIGTTAGAIGGGIIGFGGSLL